MPTKRDYYEILGVEKGATAAEIKAAYRKMAYEDKSPSALIIHQNGQFRRFVASNDFAFYIENSPLSAHQKANFIDTESESFPDDFDEVDAMDWVNPRSKHGCLSSIYCSSVLLKNGFSYTLLTYEEDCLEEEDE